MECSRTKFNSSVGQEKKTIKIQKSEVGLRARAMAWPKWWRCTTASEHDAFFSEKILPFLASTEARVQFSGNTETLFSSFLRQTARQTERQPIVKAIWAKVGNHSLLQTRTSLTHKFFLVHGSLARAGKVKSQTPKVDKQEKKKTPKGRAKKRILYNRR